MDHNVVRNVHPAAVQVVALPCKAGAPREPRPVMTIANLLLGVGAVGFRAARDARPGRFLVAKPLADRWVDLSILAGISSRPLALEWKTVKIITAVPSAKGCLL